MNLFAANKSCRVHTTFFADCSVLPTPSVPLAARTFSRGARRTCHLQRRFGADLPFDRMYMIYRMSALAENAAQRRSHSAVLR